MKLKINILFICLIFVIILIQYSFGFIVNFSQRNTNLSVIINVTGIEPQNAFYVKVSESFCFTSNLISFNSHNLSDTGQRLEKNCTLVNYLNGNIVNGQVYATFNICCIVSGQMYEISINYANSTWRESANITAFSKSPPVQNLNGTSKWGVNNLLIEWDRPSAIGGTILAYLVTIGGQLNDSVCIKRWLLSCGDCQESAQAIGQSLQDPSVRNCSQINNASSFVSTADKHLSLATNDSDVKPATSYLVIATALNEFGWGDAQSISLLTDQFTSGPVTNLAVTSLFPLSPLSIIWAPPGVTNGEIVQYFIWVQKANNECVLTMSLNCTDCKNNLSVPAMPDNTTVNCSTINGLNFNSNNKSFSMTINDGKILPYTNYTINVRSLNGHGWGSSSSKTIQTSQYISGPVSNFYCSNSSFNSIFCSWGFPSKANGVILSYTITCKGSSVVFNETVTNTSINITSNIVPDTLYILEIAASTKVGVGEKIYYNLLIFPSASPFVIDPAKIPDVLRDSIATVNDSRYQLAVTLPYNHFNNDLGIIRKFTLVISTNDDIYPRKSTITKSSYSDLTWGACQGVNKCTYEILLPEPGGQITRKKRAISEWQSRPFVIGATQSCSNSSSNTCNGPLLSATAYIIGFRVYTSAGFTTEGVITVRTAINWAILVGFFVFLLLSGGIGFAAFYFYRRYRRLNRSDSDIVVIHGDMGPDENDKSPLALNFHTHFEFMKRDSNGRLIDQFQDIKHQVAQLQNQNVLVFAEGSVHKNRYGNIRPYQHNRVKLNKLDDYINASRICVRHWNTDLNGSPCNCTDYYIATQGPLGEDREPKVSTIGDFWRMVLENNVCIIVNLTRSEENGREKCSQYWPGKNNDRIAFSSGDYLVEVTMTNFRENSIFTERVLTVSMNKYKKTIKQLHMTSWLDHSCPTTSDFMEFYAAYKRSKVQSEAIIVHCSAGVGRTGSFILIDEELSRIENRTDKVEIYNTLLNLRKCRCQMVQTESQYCFIYTIIYECLIQRGLSQVPERDRPANPQSIYHSQSYINPIFSYR